MTQRPAPNEWPSLPYEEWPATKKTLHLYTQIAGKVRLALSPPAPGRPGAPLQLTARGLSTGPMPWGSASVELGFDFLNHRLAVVASDGWSRLIPLTPARCVAEIYADVLRALDDLGVAVDIDPEPLEIPDAVALDENRDDCTYDPAAIRRWFRSLTASANALDEWRASYRGRTALLFGWGAFDVSVARYTGEHIAPAEGSSRLAHDPGAEHFVAGWWPGDDSHPEPAFYARGVPMPPDARGATVQPAGAGWSEERGAWFLGYEKVRASGSPREAIAEFLESTWSAVADAAGWEHAGAGPGD